MQAAALRLAALLCSPAAEARLSTAAAAALAASNPVPPHANARPHSFPPPVALLMEPDAKLSRLLSSAAAGGADVALLVAEDELAAGTVAVKDLRAGTQRAVTLPRSSGDGGGSDAELWQALGAADASRRNAASAAAAAAAAPAAL